MFEFHLDDFMTLKCLTLVFRLSTIKTKYLPCVSCTWVSDSNVLVAVSIINIFAYPLSTRYRAFYACFSLL